MVAESGARLLDEDAQEALRTLLVPRAAVVTPNVPEARALAGAGPEADAEELARAVHALGPAAVVVTGGPSRARPSMSSSTASSSWRSRGSATWTAPRTGPAARTRRRWRRTWRSGLEPLEAAKAAKRIASEAVRDGLRSVGAGPGPVDVFGLERP